MTDQLSVTHSCFKGQVAVLLSLHGLCHYFPTVMSAAIHPGLTRSVPGCCLLSELSTVITLD